MLYFCALFIATDYYVKKGSTDTECAEEKACGSLQAGHDKCSSYDSILVDGSLDTVTCHVNIRLSIPIKPKGSSKVEVEVNKPDDGTAVTKLFDISDNTHCIIKDFKFIIGQDSKTPETTIFLGGSYCYVRLENCEFQRKELGKDETDTDLKKALISYSSSSRGDIYLYNCIFTDLTYKDNLIELQSFYSYNSTFTNLKSKEGYVIYAYFRYVDIIDSTFDNCVCENRNGGALYSIAIDGLRIGGYNNVTRFIGCKAKDSNYGSRSNGYYDAGFGGAIYVTGLYNYYSNYYNISNVEFDKDNPNMADKKGNCMFIKDDKVNYIWTKKNVPFMKDVSSKSEDFLYSYSSDDRYNIYNLKDLYNGKFEDGPKKLYIEDKGSDGKDCSSADNACYTLSHASSTVRYHDLDITFSGNYSLNNTNSISSKTSDGEAYLSSGSDDVWIIGNGGYFDCRDNATFDGLKFVIETLKDYIILCGSSSSDSARYVLINLNSLTFLPRNESVSLSGSTNKYIFINNAAVNMNKCYFKDLTSHAVVVHLKSYSVKVSDCYFENCRNDMGSGGALLVDMKYFACSEINYDAKSICSIKGCEFTGCHAKNGGAVYLNINKYIKSITFKDNKFDNNSINTSSPAFGNDILISCSNLVEVVTKDNFPFLKGLKEDDKSAYGQDSYLNSRYVNLANLVNGYKMVDKLYIGNEGDDDNNCSDADNACKTLNHLFDEYIFYNHVTTIAVVGNYYITGINDLKYCANCTYTGNDDKANLIFGNKVLTIYNTTAFNSINILIRSYSASSNNKHFIKSYAPVVEFSKVIFKNEFEAYPIKDLFIYVHHDLKIDNCTCESLSYDGYSLFQYESNYNNIIVNNTIFNKCSAVNGGGLYLIDDANMYVCCTVKISGCKFQECKATNYGGGIYLSLNYYSNYELTSNTFHDCSGGGKNIFIGTLDIYYIDFKKIFPEIPKVDGSDDYLVASVNLNDVIEQSGKSDGTYYIGADGNSGNDCTGSVPGKLCKNYNDCSNKVKYNVFNVNIVGNTSEVYNGRLMCNFKGENSQSKIVFSTSAQYKFSFSSSISGLNVILDTKMSVGAFFFEIGTFTVDSINFKVDKNYVPGSYSVLSISSGGYLTVSNCVFDNVTGNSAHVISSSGSLTVDKCKFNNLYGRTDGLVMNTKVSDGKKLEIKASEFTNCITTDSEGGALHIETETNSSCVIIGNEDNSESTTFKGCGVSCSPYHYHIIWEENDNNLMCLCGYSRGGAIYLNIDPYTYNITMDNIAFGGEGEGDSNKGHCGYNMFISGSNLSRNVNKDNFTFLSKSSTKYEGLYYYGSYDGCGSSRYGTSLDDLRTSKGSSDDGFPWWGIFLIVLAVIIVIAIVVVVIILFICKRKGKKTEVSDEEGKEKETEKVTVDTDK